MPSESRTATITVLAAAGLLASHAVEAAPPTSPAKVGEVREPAFIENPAESHAQFLAKRLETLHTSLKLKPDQESAWTQWSDSVKAAHPDWKFKHPDGAALAKLPVPERLEKMVAFAKERLARLEDRLAETKTFYAVLSPEQRLTFDKDFNFWPHAGHGGKPAKRGHSLIGPRIGHP